MVKHQGPKTQSQHPAFQVGGFLKEIYLPVTVTG